MKKIEQQIVVISPFYNCEKYIEKCIHSVASQDYKNYLHFLINDCSTDQSLTVVINKINSLSNNIKDKFIVISNKENLGAVHNQINTLKHIFITEESIIMLLDGDDALYTNPNIFNFYNDLYDGTTEFTYGSCWSLADNIPLIAQEYPPNIKKNKLYKQYKFNWNIPYTHLRTFKKYLINNIQESVFKDKNGDWFRAGGDNATFYNIIEQAHPNKVKAISDIVCFYNDINPLNDYKVNQLEQTKNVEFILKSTSSTIEVFYYIFIPDNEHALYSFWWIDEQLKLIINSKLNDIAQINVAITMPKYKTSYGIFQFLPNGENPGLTENSTYTFEDKIKEYFRLKYPFVNILNIRDTEEENIYEQHILNYIYDSAQQDENKKILYIHTKGINLFTPYQKDWFDILNYFHITNCNKCIDYLDSYDLIGIKDKNTVNVMSGNFWWATGKYIKSLPHPNNTEQYSKYEGRYAYEHWIVYNNPNIYYLLNTQIDHYKQYYLPSVNIIREKYNIIIPTMWRYNKFCSFLNDLVISEYVENIIIIDNDEQHRPQNVILSHPKIIIKSFGKNIFVNPAWNHGVEQSTTNKICIMNDDIEFDTKLFEKVDPYYEQSFGVIGLCPGESDFNQPSITTQEIEIKPWNNEHTYGFGCLMFINKDNWVPIPPELKIYFGDNFIFDIALYNGKTNYIITNMKFTSPFATTTSDTSLVEGFLDKEHKLYMNIKSNFEMINNPIKTILIAIPTAKYIESETFKSIYDLIIPNGYKVQFQYFHGYNIAQIRNLIADWVIKGFDYLFAVDSDITFSNDTLVKLLSHNKDVVSGLYIQRLPNTHNLELYGPNGRINYEDITNKGLIEISSCGFGCVLVKKEVFVNIGYPQFEYYSAINHKDTISEDTDFCKKAINKGFKIWADTSIKCNHIGEKIFSIIEPEQKTEHLNSIKARLIELGNQRLLPLPHINYLHYMKNTLNIFPKVIYDIGACVLHWTNEAKLVWNNATFVVFEAMEETKFLYENNNLLHYNGVLSDYDNKKVNFYKNVTHPGGNSYYRENVEVNPESELYFPDETLTVIITKTLDTIVKENNFPLPDLIKMDVQGAELDILKGAKETLKSCQHLILELQSVEYNKGAPLKTEVIDYLHLTGFDLVNTEPFCNAGPDADYHFVKVGRII